LIKWGKQAGKQRYKCKKCSVLSTASNQGVSSSNRFVWFKSWVVGRQTFTQISNQSGYSERTLKRYFYKYLDVAPTFVIHPNEKLNLLVDGTYFSHDLCLILYRDNTIKYTQLYRFSNGEWYEELREDIQNLLSLGLHIESITCDGHPALLKAIKATDKSIITQRCLVHIQRMCRIWLTMRPQSAAGIELRSIVGRLHKITDQESKGYWIVDIVNWHKKHIEYVNEKSYSDATGRYWYKHKMVRKAFTVIKRALPNMFHYLDNPDIPKSTNGLESFFGHLKTHITVHRGLSSSHRKNFIKWYLQFRNE
jgi:hypothetical protein